MTQVSNHLPDSELSFVELERRVQGIPDGPAGLHTTPRWIKALNAVGWVGMLLGLAPSLLIKFLPPELWMLWMARIGLWMMILGLGPSFVRNMYFLVTSAWQWRAGLVLQMDHDVRQYRELRQWLASFSVNDRAEALRFTRQGQERLAAKIGLIVGSLEKLGVLPVLIAISIQVKTHFEQLGETPAWQVMLALFFALIYLIGWLGSLMRLRLQLYEMILVDSLDMQDGSRAETP